MKNYSLGFIGGGRATRIILTALERKGSLPENIAVSDVCETVLNDLKSRFPGIILCPGDNNTPARQEVVFISLHPPVIPETLASIKNDLNAGSLVVSLAPKFTIGRLSELLGGFKRIVRMIPNAPSIINLGFNPVSFSDALCDEEKDNIMNYFSILGKSPEVEENKLEAYAVLTAMGPTYFWFQLYELKNIAGNMGLDENESMEGILGMMHGALEMMQNGSLTQNDVTDLIPVKPLLDQENVIKNILQSRLSAIFEKIRPS